MNKPGEAQKALEDLAANAPTGYATLSRLRLAGYDQGAGNIAEAASAYEDIAKDSSVDPILADYARLQIAMLKLDSASFTDLKNRLTPLAAEKNPWRFSARELLGMAAYKAGLTAEARNHFQRLIADRTAPPGIAERARTMLAVLAEAEQASKPAPATEKSEPSAKPEPAKEDKAPARAQATRPTRETQIVASQDSTRKPAPGQAGTRGRLCRAGRAFAVRCLGCRLRRQHAQAAGPQSFR